ncbi:hypothetical protein ACFL4D_01475 [Candidatus Margulisiibacteriota bacterium]
MSKLLLSKVILANQSDFRDQFILDYITIGIIISLGLYMTAAYILLIGEPISPIKTLPVSHETINELTISDNVEGRQ